MFRLISLNLDDPANLGHIAEGQLVFVPSEEVKSTRLPYTTVIIGPNGTGKSTLLSYLAKIFEDLKFFKDKSKRNPDALKFQYIIEYKIGKNKYKISHIRSMTVLTVRALGGRQMWRYHVLLNDETLDNWTYIELPEQIIAVSYLPLDRFRQKKNLPEDYYQYLGLRHRSNAASPQYFLNNTLPLLFDYISKSNSTWFLKEILNFMEVDKNYLGVQLVYRYKRFFFTGDITREKFIELFENMKLFSKREGKSFALDYFNKYVKRNQQLIDKIVTYLNIRAKQDKIILGEKSLLEFNLFDNFELIEELDLLLHLQKLDLLASATLLFRKEKANLISAQNLSSGEFHFLTTMIAIQATIKNNSLILIDEPDTSLHPNWQMKYVANLKMLLKNWNSNHLIMATHSHFIVSDLEGESSEVIGIRGRIPYIDPIPINRNTFGWSAEEVLYKIFNIKTSRNYYLEYDLTKLVSIINTKEGSNREYQELVRILNKLNSIKFSKEDPVNIIIEKANKYLKKQNAKH